MGKPPKIRHYSEINQARPLPMQPTSQNVVSQHSVDSQPEPQSDPQSDLQSESQSEPQGIKLGSHVTLHFRVTLGDGQVVLDTFSERPATLQVGQGQLSPALERCLIALQEGDERSYNLGPDDGFGPRNPELIQRISRSLLNEHSDQSEPLESGDIVEFPAPDGARFAGIFKGWEDEAALFDFNHPLAGQPVKFDVKIIGLL
jgi:FKBP-type peptidyl-prolyl cis-trans isomerase SlpA